MTCPPHLADELGDEVVLDALFAAFGAVAALFEPAEGKLSDDHIEVVDADHAGFEPAAHHNSGLGAIRGLRRVLPGVLFTCDFAKGLSIPSDAPGRPLHPN
jgi:hypothetical protein